VNTSHEVTPLPSVEEPGLIYRRERQTTEPAQRSNPDNPAWGVGGALFVWFLSILLVIFMPLLFLIPYASYKGIHFGAPNYLPALVEFATKDKTGVLLQLLALLPSHLITLFLVWALVTRFGRRSFRAAIGWEWSTQLPWWVDLLLSVMLGIVLFGAGNIVARLLGAEKPTQLEHLINSSLAARYMISFLAVFTAPFAEEFIYRGVLYSALRKTVGVYCGWLLAFVTGAKLNPHTEDRLGVSGAVVLVLGLFTIIHVPQYWPNFGVIAAVALLSIVLTLVRAFSGRLLPCIVIHLVFNGIQALLLILEPYLHRLAPTPDQIAPTAGLLLPFINFCF
jgi:membrane protease YdiL (CAAX protease family)